MFFTDGDKLNFFPAWMSAWSLSKGHKHGRQMPFPHTGIIMGTHSANGTRYYAKPSLVGRDHTQNEPRGSQWDQLRNREINPSKSLVSTNCYIFNWFVSFYHPGQLKQILLSFSQILCYFYTSQKELYTFPRGKCHSLTNKVLIWSIGRLFVILFNFLFHGGGSRSRRHQRCWMWKHWLKRYNVYTRV